MNLFRGNRLILGLAGIAGLQTALVLRQIGPEDSGRSTWFEVGESLSGIRAVDSTGTKQALFDGRAIVLLVFRSDCNHCDEAAPDWEKWIRSAAPGVRKVALSSEPLASARTYASQKHWATEVWSVEGSGRRSPEAVLTSRTPWVFVVDSNGVILGEGPGSQLPDLARLLDPQQKREAER